MAGFTWDMGALAPDKRPPQIPGYELFGPIGHGGMGTVYRAQDAGGRPVAVKILQQHLLTHESRARFGREAELLSRIDHPGILRPHGWGEYAGLCWVATDLVDGARHIDDAAEAFDLDGRLALIEAMVEAVGAAHAAGIVHRDLKPGNVLVDVHGRVKVIDFGVSRGVGMESLTQTGQFVGTPLYAPAERFSPRGRDDDPRGDVWSLAAVAYELLTGVTPYPADTVAQLHDRGRRRATPACELEPALAPWISDVLLRALDPDVTQRYADAQAFAQALREPPSPTAGSRWAAALSVVAVLLALAVGAAAAVQRGRRADLAASPPLGRVEPTASPAAAEPSPPATVTDPDAIDPASGDPDVTEPVTTPSVAPEATDPDAVDPEELDPDDLDPADDLDEPAESVDLPPLPDEPLERLVALRELLLEGLAPLTLFEGLEPLIEALATEPEIGPHLYAFALDWCEAYARSAEERQIKLRLRRLVRGLQPVAGVDHDALRYASELAILSKRLRLQGMRVFTAFHDNTPDALPANLGPFMRELALKARLIADLQVEDKVAPELVQAVRPLLDNRPTEPHVAEALHRLAEHAQSLLRLRAAVGAFNQGKVKLGQAALRHARNWMRRRRGGRFQAAYVEIALGDLDKARGLAEPLTGWRRQAIELELALVGGEPKAIRAARDALAAERGGSVTLRQVLALHAAWSLGELTEPQVLQRVRPLIEAYDPNKIAFGARPPWHTPQGFLRVVKGGWWPGRR